MKNYPISLEVAGELAHFARVDTAGAPISSPVPPWSAAKGLLESVAFFADGSAWLHPLRVEICRRAGTLGGEIRFQRYATNYGGPLRKEQSIRHGTTMQFFATVLAGVCYRIHAEVRSDEPRSGGRNPRHHLQEVFQRRLARGQCFRTPALGWREFTCDYWGTFRDGWEVDDRLNLTIVSMLDRVWDHETQGRYVSSFRQNVSIVNGVLNYAE